MRIFALSDIHVDYSDNMAWVERLSRVDYRDDVLALAGDVSHSLVKAERALEHLRERFARVFFVPGNHDLWLAGGSFEHSLDKLDRFLELCRALDVETEPARVAGAWLVPLFSWYSMPEEGDDSLFFPKPSEDPSSLDGWGDNHLVVWPPLPGGATAAEHFLARNRPHLDREYDAPVISFSHFLPRRELILATPEEDAAAGGPVPDPHPEFNFSRVAGSAGLDHQIRRLGARVHVYGHQHRNRRRAIDGVLYVSHCLGYRTERRAGMIRDLGSGPRVVWDQS